MKKNVGSSEQILRIFAAAVMVTMYYVNTELEMKMFSTMTMNIALVISGVFVVTAFAQFCPLHALFGTSSCKECKKDKDK